ncbi:ROK family protein [Methylocella silvestris BL2]|uniref:ROK family protein n=1 Tax=Methylocella silvestris (strain DSM 15510 / CIP 108128 / LMG 27833 / NCIMB 13906 / BL2) TaxID=395965 RepID=B8EN77_METSB|nr:ROK family protein [Methylocella silvestris]ACK49590.1 ROK family protein [Methylocella silvestris BL2]
MRIGIDLGGTKIEVLALDDSGSELIRKRQPTPAGDYAGTLDVIAELVAFVEAATGRKGSVGVAAPGAISPATGLVKNANSTVLNGKAFDRDLSAKLGRPVKIENDANCFALSEASDGAGAGVSVVFGVILGTGVGGGLVVDGKLVSGRNRIAGEWGHNPLPSALDDERPGPACYCGKFGCIETFLSGPGLARDYFARTGAALTAHEIAAAAASGETEAGRLLALYCDRLARGLAGVINIVDPDVIAVGGGLSNIDALYSGLPELIARYAFSDRIDTAVRRAVHGDSSGVRGAAWLWPIAAP